MNKLSRQLNRFLSRLIQRLFATKNRGSFSGPFRGSFSVANCGLSLIDQGTLAGAGFVTRVDFEANFVGIPDTSIAGAAEKNRRDHRSI